jgi:putative hemolysin
MFHLWNGLADYVLDRGIEVLFGAASFMAPMLRTALAPCRCCTTTTLPPEMRVTRPAAAPAGR